jgi:hypothetical protein
MRFACWIAKAADTHSEYVIFIAYPRQQWLRERAPVYVTHTLLALSLTVHCDTSAAVKYFLNTVHYIIISGYVFYDAGMLPPDVM